MFNPEKMRQSNPQEALPGGFDIRVKSLAHEGHPERNEDAMFMRKDKRIFGVLDGIGGSAGGDVASSHAKNYIVETLEKLPEGLSLEQTWAGLERVLREANERILQLVAENPVLKGMGTTASVVKIWEGTRGQRKAVVANVGDSRVYILRANGRLEQITLDDNIVSQVHKDEQQARRLQEKLNNVVDIKTLNAEEQKVFGLRNQIYQWLGAEGINPRIYTADVRDGEKIVVTSDGIHDNLTDTEIAQILITTKDNQRAVESLANASRNRSREQHLRAKADDMSAIVAEFSADSVSKREEKNLYVSELTIRGYKAMIDAKMGIISLRSPLGKIHEIKKGDDVRVYIDNPMSGKVSPTGKEAFGKMSGQGSFERAGGKFAIVRRGETEVIVPIAEFIEAQISKIEELERREARERDRGISRVVIRPEIHDPLKNTIDMSEEQMKETAKRFGVDVTKQNWEQEYQKKIRNVTGA